MKKKSNAEVRQADRYQLNIKLDKEKDKMLIDLLEAQKNKQGYIKYLLLKEATDIM